MDIMDSTDTPTGGLSTNTASSSSSAALPLSVDQRDDFASPTNRNYAGSEPTSFGSSSFSSGGSAFDRVDLANRMDSMPTSTDDIMMPHIEHASHPSILDGQPTVDATTTTDHTASAKAKASELADKAKAKAADLQDKASDAADSAKAKASSLADSAKAKAADVQDKAADTADSVKGKLAEGAERVKEGGNRLLEMAKSGLHQAEDKLKAAEKSVEERLEHSKEDVPSGREPSRPEVQSTRRPEETDTHPDASSMRDAHLHQPLSSLPSHGNEIHPVKEPLMTDVHHNALIAGEAAHARAVANQGQAEKEDPLQRGGFLHRMHDKVEDGAEAIKDKVDGFLERNVRTESDEHLSAADGRDLPTLIDSSHEHNVEQVRRKMHPSQERP